MEKRSKNKPIVDENTQLVRDVVLKKHVGLIHCENKLTLIQRKICNVLLFNALDKINEKEIHEISLRQLCSLVGYNSHDSQLIKEAIKSLITTIMEWNLLDDDIGPNDNTYPNGSITWNASALLAGASIKRGIIQYAYSPQMKSVLASLEIYGRINLFVQAKFNSAYSLVLYENCVRFKNIKQTAWFPIDLFRSLMGVHADKYASFKEFKRNVINVAVNEINQKADISIEPQFKKMGRTIVAVQFILSDNKKYLPTFRKITPQPKPSLAKEADQSLLGNSLRTEFHLSEKQAQEMIDNYPKDYILEKMHLIGKKKNIEHKGAFLYAALKKDYRESQSNDLIRVQPQEANAYLRQAKAASEIQPLKNKYLLYKFKSYIEFVNKEPSSTQTMIYAKFKIYLQPKKEIGQLYRRTQFNSPFVMSEFIQFIDLQFKPIVGDYMAFEDFITAEEVCPIYESV